MFGGMIYMSRPLYNKYGYNNYRPPYHYPIEVYIVTVLVAITFHLCDLCSLQQNPAIASLPNFLYLLSTSRCTADRNFNDFYG